MPTFGDHELVTLDEAAWATGPDVLTTCRTIVDRVDLVAQNFAEAMPQLQEETATATGTDYPVRWIQAKLRAEATGVEQLREDLPGVLRAGHPLEAAFRGLRAISFMLETHTWHAAEIFKEYTPVYPNPEWSKFLHEPEFAKFGYYVEPLIEFAVAVQEFEEERYVRYGHLFMSAIRYGELPLNSPFLHRMPLLN